MSTPTPLPHPTAKLHHQNIASWSTQHFYLDSNCKVHQQHPIPPPTSSSLPIQKQSAVRTKPPPKYASRTFGSNHGIKPASGASFFSSHGRMHGEVVADDRTVEDKLSIKAELMKKMKMRVEMKNSANLTTNSTGGCYFEDEKICFPPDSTAISKRVDSTIPKFSDVRSQNSVIQSSPYFSQQEQHIQPKKSQKHQLMNDDDDLEIIPPKTTTMAQKKQKKTNKNKQQQDQQQQLQLPPQPQPEFQIYNSQNPFQNAFNVFEIIPDHHVIPGFNRDHFTGGMDITTDLQNGLCQPIGTPFVIGGRRYSFSNNMNNNNNQIQSSGMTDAKKVLALIPHDDFIGGCGKRGRAESLDEIFFQNVTPTEEKKVEKDRWKSSELLFSNMFDGDEGNGWPGILVEMEN